MLRGLMMDRPLLTTGLLRHAAQTHGGGTIASRFAAEAPHRYTWRDAWDRVQQLAHVLAELGVKPGDRVGTIAWNDHRHLELYYAVPGIGAVCHTINPRLFPEQITYIVNHAQDDWLFVDPMFLPLVERLWPNFTGVKGVVLMTRPELMPAQSAIPTLHCYETLMQGKPGTYDFAEFDENTACGLCYTSGTTGNPKGVLYSHRSSVLHAYGFLTAPGITVRADDTALVVVPLFHANAWGYPYAAAIVGANLVLPGPKLDGKSVYELMEQEAVTVSSGVPTVWLGLLAHMRQAGARFSTLKSVTVGGSALPRAMLEEFELTHGVTCVQGWGMTEMSPVGTVGALTPEQAKLPVAQQHDAKLKAGRALYGVEMKVVGPDGAEVPRDGVSYGELVVRGPWITSGYYNDAAASAGAFTEDGWFKTGDVATIDENGAMAIVDRAKDVIKSGGEWISSIDLENAAMSHPAVQEAAVVGVPHPKWQERPLLVLVLRQGHEATRDELMAYLEQHVAKWWLPDDIVFVPDLPHTATGKLLKTELRKRFATYRLPGAQEAAE
ncbi:long-chain-fatty-acid--CoA ligase [Aerophototrophica crusticola]|uniref:3-methylmercaptopropionyl-CoA ligase n=1 Tax=Aerophototrophica crusticola TaxID=1709002 RepID=A0A858RB08_9PROT|nr:long-chain-fatty-acid--CoA ligase [Rhodospirillaceae bacterium B3]